MQEETKEKTQATNINLPIAIIAAGFLIAIGLIAGNYFTSSKTASVIQGPEQSDIYHKLAQEIHLDIEQFSECVTSQKYKNKVEADYQEGIAMGVQGTPATFVNGDLISGAVPYEMIEEQIQQIPIGEQITIVEFSDFECPFCARFHTTTKQLMANYPDIEIAFKHFPLNFHAAARPAAEASECAREQGKFWEYADKIFENQINLQ